MAEKKFTNDTGIPVAMAVWLAHDSYNHDPRPNVISVTTLIKPVRRIILESRVGSSAAPADISTRLASRIGTAVHDAIEHSWTSNYQQGLRDLGYPQRAIDNIRVNPENPSEDHINVFLEKRSEKAVGNFIISGQFDMVYDGTIMDIKSTSTYTYTTGCKTDDYINQLSIYRWLNPDIIENDVGAIQFIFKDWSALKAKTESGYPSMPVFQQKLNLKTYHETENMIRVKLMHLEMNMQKPEPELPLCTPKELGQKPSIWKHYASVDSKRATSGGVFLTPHEAYAFQAQKGKGIIKEIKGEVTGCRFCLGKELCSQFKGMVARGEIKS